MHEWREHSPQDQLLEAITKRLTPQEPSLFDRIISGLGSGVSIASGIGQLTSRPQTTATRSIGPASEAETRNLATSDALNSALLGDVGLRRTVLPGGIVGLSGGSPPLTPLQASGERAGLSASRSLFGGRLSPQGRQELIAKLQANGIQAGGGGNPGGLNLGSYVGSAGGLNLTGPSSASAASGGGGSGGLGLSSLLGAAGALAPLVAKYGPGILERLGLSAASTGAGTLANTAFNAGPAGAAAVNAASGASGAVPSFLGIDAGEFLAPGAFDAAGAATGAAGGAGASVGAAAPSALGLAAEGDIAGALQALGMNPGLAAISLPLSVLFGSLMHLGDRSAKEKAAQAEYKAAFLREIQADPDAWVQKMAMESHPIAGEFAAEALAGSLTMDRVIDRLGIRDLMGTQAMGEFGPILSIWAGGVDAGGRIDPIAIFANSQELRELIRRIPEIRAKAEAERSLGLERLTAQYGEDIPLNLLNAPNILAATAPYIGETRVDEDGRTLVWREDSDGTPGWHRLSGGSED